MSMWGTALEVTAMAIPMAARVAWVLAALSAAAPSAWAPSLCLFDGKCLDRFIDYSVNMPNPSMERARNQTPCMNTSQARKKPAPPRTSSTAELRSLVRCWK